MSRRSALVVLAPVWLVIACSEATLDAVEPHPHAFTEGLVAHWKLDEGSGTVSKDSSGNSHDGLRSGTTWISDARFGGGVRLASGDSIAVADFPGATPSWSVSLWVRFSEQQLTANGETFTTILSTENVGSGGWEVNLDRQLAKPRYVFSYWAPPLMAYVGTECSCVATGTWQHLTAVVDDAGDQITLYVDGVPTDQITRPSDVPPGDSTLHFGRWNMSGRLLSGDLDEIAIWQRALTAEEVSALNTRSP